MSSSPIPSTRILSIDGGGIRGLVAAIWLERLEREVGAPLLQCFDVVAGTSTGAILACGVAAGFPVRAMVQLYRRSGRLVFPAPPTRRWGPGGRAVAEESSGPRYGDQGLGDVLRRAFGDRRLGDVPSDKLLLVPAYDTRGRVAFPFRSTDPKLRAVPLWEVAKASSSAPMYFPAHELDLGEGPVPLIDGAVVASNPAAWAIAEALRARSSAGRGQGLNNLVVASFGTGRTTRPIRSEEARAWGPAEWSVPLLDVVMDGAAEAVDEIAAALIPRDRYFRFQTRLDAAFDDLDCADAANLDALAREAQAFLEADGGDERARLLAKLLKEGS